MVYINILNFVVCIAATLYNIWYIRTCIRAKKNPKEENRLPEYEPPRKSTEFGDEEDYKHSNHYQHYQ